MALPIFARCSGVSVPSAAAASAILPGNLFSFRTSAFTLTMRRPIAGSWTKLSRHRRGAERECGDRNRTKDQSVHLFPPVFGIFPFPHFTGEVLYCRAISTATLPPCSILPTAL